MYFDTCELPLTFGIKAPCSFSGIYFRPTFHYPHFAHYVPSRKDRLQHWREKFTLNRILRHPQLHTLFSLDPFAVKYLQRFHSKVNLLHLPDPIEIHPVESEAVNHLREQLAIEAGRKVFLLFGALDGRKGIYQLLAALSQVPLEVSQQICLILAGAPSAAERIVLQQQVDAVRQSHQVQIIERYEFLPEADIPVYFQLADVVLALYQRHVGMSGILLWAAAAQKPILSSNYGLMGEMVRAYQLGLAIDSTQPEAIAQGLTQLLSQPLEQVGDRAAMQRFAEQNAAENFAQIIFSQILKPSL
jgi:glycosyltransferase involved in cell wall biosynthesis